MPMQRLFVLLFLFSASAFGQQRGSLTGQVQLAGGKFAGAGIAVNVSSLTSGLTARGQTDLDGVFRIGNLPAGEYRVFAAARMQAVTEGSETILMIVSAGRQGPFNRGNGTYFRGTPNLEDATPVVVAAEATTANIDIVLAPGGSIDLPVHIVHGRFVDERGGFPTIGSNELNLVLSDGPANVFSDITFIGGFRRPAPDAPLYEQLSGPKAIHSVLAMPTTEDGKFRLVLPEGVYRVSPQGPMKNNGRDARYYIKSMSYGTSDLMKDLLTLRGPNQNEFIITLAKCAADSAKEPMCQ